MSTIDQIVNYHLGECNQYVKQKIETIALEAMNELLNTMVEKNVQITCQDENCNDNQLLVWDSSSNESTESFRKFLDLPSKS